MRTKKSIITTLILIICIALGGLFMFTKSKQASKQKTINIEKSFDITSVNTINVDTEDGYKNLNIIQYDGDLVKVKIEGIVRSNREINYALDLKKTENTLLIRPKRSSKFHLGVSIIESDVNVKIFIPHNYNKNVKINCHYETLDLSSLKLNNLDLTCKSKNVNIKDYSGNLNITGEYSYIDVSYKEFDNTIKINSSRDITLKIPENSLFQLEAKVKELKKLNLDFPIIEKSKSDNTFTGVVGSAENKIQLNSDYGKVSVLKY